MSARPEDRPIDDAHLRAALAHAPDRDAAPPPRLSAHIRAEALRATAPGPGWRHRLLAALDLLQRPAVGAAFASLVLGTAIVLIWRDADAPQVMHPGTPAAVLGDATAPMPRPASGASGEIVPAPAKPAASVSRPAPAAPGKPAPPAAHEVAPSAPAAALRAAAASPRAQTQRANAPAVMAEQAAPSPSIDAATAASAMPSEPPPTPAPAMAPPAPAPIAGEAEAKLDASRARAAAPGAALSRSFAAAAGPLAPLAALQAALAADEPATRWLREVDGLTHGQWRVVPAPAHAAEPLIGPGGATLGRLGIDDDGVLWQPGSMAAQAWRAPLPAGHIERLRRALDDWRNAPAAPASAPR